MKFSSPTQKIGRKAEEVALQYLTRAGLKLITQNFSCRLGEIDLILWDQKTVVFAEVRYRSSTNYISPKETITPNKQRRIWKTAQYFLVRQKWIDAFPCRFDVLAIYSDRAPSIEWIKDAFRIER